MYIMELGEGNEIYRVLKTKKNIYKLVDLN